MLQIRKKTKRRKNPKRTSIHSTMTASMKRALAALAASLAAQGDRVAAALEDAAAIRETVDGFDLVVANPAGEPGAGFGTPTNRVTLIGDGEPEGLPLLSKEEVAERILDRVESLLVKGAGPAAGAGS